MLNNNKNPVSVSIIGGSGYTGAELIRLISKHPYFDLNQVVANRNAGKKIRDIFPHLRHLKLPDFISFEQMNFDNVDLIFCALPHSTSQEIIVKIPRGKKLLICQQILDWSGLRNMNDGMGQNILHTLYRKRQFMA